MYHSCTIKRTKEIAHLEFSMDDKSFIEKSKETRTEPCDTPLFADDQRKAGVCQSCREGWEVAGNVFASESERQRALTADVKPRSAEEKRKSDELMEKLKNRKEANV